MPQTLRELTFELLTKHSPEEKEKIALSVAHAFGVPIDRPLDDVHVNSIKTSFRTLLKKFESDPVSVLPQIIQGKIIRDRYKNSLN